MPKTPRADTSLSLMDRIRGKRTKDIHLPGPAADEPKKKKTEHAPSRNPLTRLRSALGGAAETARRGRPLPKRGGGRR